MLTVFFYFRYKGISICFNIMQRCLGGRYINFGVFWLYQDKAIDEAFHMMFQLMLSIPLDDLMVGLHFPQNKYRSFDRSKL